MTTAKKKPDEKKASSNTTQPLPQGMLGTKEIAAKLKIEPRYLRVVLRDVGKGTGGERYQWRENDPFLAKLPALVTEHRNQAEAAKKAKTA